MTDTTNDPRGVRRPTRMDTLCALAAASEAEVTAVIDVFREPSRAFLMPPAGEPLKPNTVVDISHESLMRAWRRLSDWAADEAQSAQMYRRLAETASLHAAGKSGLWRDPDLQLALNWRQENEPDQRWAERYRPGFDNAMRFLDKSAEAREAERRAAWRTKVVYPMALAGVLVVALGAWAINAAQNRQALAILRAEAEAARNAVSQSRYANQALQQSLPRAGREKRKSVVVEYFPKNVDENKVEAALTELGFTLRKPAAIVQQIPTNAIWFGSPVDIEDVKLVALTLIRAGVQIRAIRPIQDYLVNKKDLPLIQVGADSSVVNDPPLTVEQIQAASRFTR